MGEYARLHDNNAGQPQGSHPQPTGPYPGYNTMQPGAPVIPGPQQSQAYRAGPSFRPRSLHRKSLLEAYLLWLILGLLGAHHFYLRRPVFGVLYIFTFGLLGCGWLFDLFRLPYLVRKTNKERELPTEGKNKNISDAYTLWFPFGILGFHHFYLNNVGFGVLYFFTFGLMGIGWLVDLCRMPSLVKKANTPTKGPEMKSLCTAYMLGLSPVGILGAHHFYLNRPITGIFYFFTFGNFGIGWILDWFRMHCLVKRTNKDIAHGPDYMRHYDDAYLYWFPFGLLGAHHFYLLRPAWGFVYFFTLGLGGIGWLIDLCRLPFLVRNCNKQIEARRRIPTTFGVSPEGIGYPIMPTQRGQLPFNGYRAPLYGPPAESATAATPSTAFNQQPQMYNPQQQYHVTPNTNLGQPPPYTP